MSFGRIGTKPCFAVETSFVVTFEVERSESLTAAKAGVTSPLRNFVASDGELGTSETPVGTWPNAAASCAAEPLVRPVILWAFAFKSDVIGFATKPPVT